MIHENCYFIERLKDHGATLTYCNNAYRQNGNIPLKTCESCKDYITKELADKMVYRYLELRKVRK